MLHFRARNGSMDASVVSDEFIIACARIYIQTRSIVCNKEPFTAFTIYDRSVACES